MALIDKDQLKAEIERRRLHFNKEAEKYQALNNGYSQNCYGARDALRDLENFLDTLPEQPVIKKSNALFDKCVENCDPAVMKEVSDNIDKMLGRQPLEGLEEFRKEVIKFSQDHFDELHSDMDTIDIVHIIARHFAEWQKVQGQKTIELAEDHAMLAGMNKMEQQMMEKAVEKYVHELYTDEEGYHCYISLGTEYAPGDKVKIIVIKEG